MLSLCALLQEVAMKALTAFALATVLLGFLERNGAAAPEPGLLFYLSGERELTADWSSGGTPEPTFVKDVKVISDGAMGRALECQDTQLLAYRAPGNIYAERGTLAFAWRSRYPVGKTAFPVWSVPWKRLVPSKG